MANPHDPEKAFAELLELQVAAVDTMLTAFTPPTIETGQWAESAGKLQDLWRNFYALPARGAEPPPRLPDPAEWLGACGGGAPVAARGAQRGLWRARPARWKDVRGQCDGGGERHPPRKDRRFAAARWRTQPLCARIHQTYL